MNNSPMQSTMTQQKTIGFSLLAFYFIVSIIVALIAPHRDVVALYVNILASLAIIGGISGLLIYLARQLHWPLPEFLQVPEGMRDSSWRLLALSLAAIAMPLLIIFTRSVLLHQ